MKNLLLASLLLASPTFVRADDDPSNSANTVALEYIARLMAPARVARGMSPQEVQTNLGAPRAQLAPNIWVYWDFKAKDVPHGDKFDAALVIFAHNRVERVKLCDGEAVRTFLAQQEARTVKAAHGALAAN